MRGLPKTSICGCESSTRIGREREVEAIVDWMAGLDGQVSGAIQQSPAVV